MSRIFHVGEEIKVVVDEEFDIRMDDAPQGISAQLIDEELLAISGSADPGQEVGSTYFHFKAIAAGIQKIEFPPSLLRQTVEIQNLIGVPIMETADEAVGAEPLLGTE